MDIIKVNPQGFCKGVIRAIMIINKALEDQSLPRPLYMYGGLVHNKHVIDAYIEKGIIIVDDISNIFKGTIIITAHGVSDNIIKMINDRGLGLINATCHDVIKTHDLIKEKLTENYDIIFYGKQNHPETKGILGISDKIILIQNVDDIDPLHLDNTKIAFTTQTTMAYLDVLKIIAKLKEKYPEIKTYEEVCTATKVRQNSLIEIAQTVDFVIVVGDPTSNNTTKLKEVCDKYTHTPCIMIETLNDLSNYDLSKYQKIAITAGASTPSTIVNEIIDGIKNNYFVSHLKNEDYLTF